MYSYSKRDEYIDEKDTYARPKTRTIVVLSVRNPRQSCSGGIFEDPENANATLAKSSEDADRKEVQEENSRRSRYKRDLR